ncbi:hypothetical protein EV182_005171 [Spiromyces aspiralis]|uniref:Uncharacterized protein n=1 Tax=Spiromyces aspiralis TaxID=68401 RepID=A0ACC1HVK8_9FUNG|nr:hypothetical protein EV182_005171 [Spiromyces aspiralis]
MFPGLQAQACVALQRLIDQKLALLEDKIEKMASARQCHKICESADALSKLDSELLDSDQPLLVTLSLNKTARFRWALNTRKSVLATLKASAPSSPPPGEAATPALVVPAAATEKQTMMTLLSSWLHCPELCSLAAVPPLEFRTQVPHSRLPQPPDDTQPYYITQGEFEELLTLELQTNAS